MPKPTLFIGSSVEGLSVAHAIQANLEHEVEITTWNQGVFVPSRTTIETLVDSIKKFGFAAFVMSADDVVNMRGKEAHTVRDNVLFELGLAIGALGRDRTFIVVPRGADLHLPTDLLGVTSAGYDSSRSDNNLVAALGPACLAIKQGIAAASPKRTPPVAEAPATPMDDADILSVLESWMGGRPDSDNTKVMRFDEVDALARVPAGSARRFLAKAAERWSYVVAREGATTILFRDAPRRVRESDRGW